MSQQPSTFRPAARVLSVAAIAAAGLLVLSACSGEHDRGR